MWKPGISNVSSPAISNVHPKANMKYSSTRVSWEDLHVCIFTHMRIKILHVCIFTHMHIKI